MNTYEQMLAYMRTRATPRHDDELKFLCVQIDELKHLVEVRYVVAKRGAVTGNGEILCSIVGESVMPGAWVDTDWRRLPESKRAQWAAAEGSFAALLGQRAAASEFPLVGPLLEACDEAVARMANAGIPAKFLLDEVKVVRDALAKAQEAR